MATHGVFIGVNRHSDLRIRELSCARTDALALSALFKDSGADLVPVTLVDEDATLARVRGALEDAFTGASPDDIVIVTFSGHGTPDHSLVVFDTNRDDLRASCVDLPFLSGLFTKSRAHAVLLVLDCCFSGGAPARVLEDAGAAGGPDLGTIAGRGRVILAATAPDEQAWEQVSAGHGLLTKAAIDVLSASTPTVDVVEAAASIIREVRARAAQMGRVQTPTLLGFIQGGFVLPALRRGDAYRKAFPQHDAKNVTADIASLSALGIPANVLDQWKARFPNGLNALQLEAVNEYRILGGANVVISAPTGAGKTFVGEMAAIRAVTDGRKAVFLLPYRALVNEKFEEFSASYGRSLGLRVARCTGDYQDQIAEFTLGRYDLALLTYEMFLNIAIGKNAILDQLGVVVIDEAQFITDPKRGITVELLLTALLVARDRGAAPQLLALSAVIGSMNGFERWLAARALVTKERPVPLIEGVLDRRGTYRYLDEQGVEQSELLLSPREIVQRRDEPKTQDVVVPLVRKLLRDPNETVLLFRNQRGSAQGCAEYLAADLQLPAAANAIAALPAQDRSATSRTLKRCLERGTAVHNANLTREERVAVEHAFRTGELRVLAATTTLAAGINTPASTVILAEHEFLGEGGRRFTVAEYKNMAGRAGRPGYGNTGRAVILAETPFEADRLFRQYVCGQPEPIESSFDIQHIDTWVLRLLAQVKQLPVPDVLRLLTNTFAGYRENARDPRWQPMAQERLVQTLDRMTRLDLVEYEGGLERIQLSLLGRACGQSSLSFDSCMRLVELLRRIGAKALLTPEALVTIVQALPESDGAYTPLMKNSRKDRATPEGLAYRIGGSLVRHLQAYAGEPETYLRRCKRCLVLLDWLDGVPVEVIEETHSASPYAGKISSGDIRSFADTTRFHLRAAAEISQVMFVGEGPAGEDVDATLKRLELGAPDAALPLLEIRAPWTRGAVLAAAARGMRSLGDLLALEEAELTALVGPDCAGAIRSVAPQSPHVPTENPQ